MSISAHSTTVVTESTARRSSGFLQWFLPFAIGVGVTVVTALLVMMIPGLPEQFAWFVLGLAWMSTMWLFPLVFVLSLVLWAIPATRYRAGWLGPLAGWVLSPFVAFALDGEGDWSQFTGYFNPVPMTAIPTALMIAIHFLLRLRRRS